MNKKGGDKMKMIGLAVGLFIGFTASCFAEVSSNTVWTSPYSRNQLQETSYQLNRSTIIDINSTSTDVGRNYLLISTYPIKIGSIDVSSAGDTSSWMGIYDSTCTDISEKLIKTLHINGATLGSYMENLEHEYGLVVLSTGAKIATYNIKYRER